MRFCLLFLTLSLVFGNSLKVNSHECNKIEKNKYEDISFKESILLAYYKKYSEHIVDSSKILLFENYVDLYESYDFNLYTFNNYLLSNSVEDSFKENLPDLRSSGEAVDKYSLGNYNYTLFPYSTFKNGLPSMDVFDYSILQVGDIFIENKVENYYHVGVIVDPNHLLTYNGSNYSFVQTIEAINSNPGVQYGYLDDQRIVDHNIVLRRYYSRDLTNIEKNDLVTFLNEQTDASYMIHFFEQNTSIYSTEWYCGELVWAAYLYIEINLLNLQPPYTTNFPIIGTDFINCELLSPIETIQSLFLSFSILGKTSNIWYIRIYNFRNFNVTAYYNSKMCFSEDAKNWQNLTDINSISIAAYSFEDIYISENFLATTIACSYLYYDLSDFIRMITYADLLNINGNLAEMYNYIVL